VIQTLIYEFRVEIWKGPLSKFPPGAPHNLNPTLCPLLFLGLFNNRSLPTHAEACAQGDRYKRGNQIQVIKLYKALASEGGP